MYDSKILNMSGIKKNKESLSYMNQKIKKSEGVLVSLDIHYAWLVHNVELL